MVRTPTLSDDDRANRHRNRMAKRSREAFDSVSDIGIIPLVENVPRRAACRQNLERFLVEYFPESTGLAPFGSAQKRAIKRIERAILKGGRFLNLFPRGFAKSTISENAMIWAVLYGHRSYVVFFGAKSEEAAEAIESIKKELSENELIAADFPEVAVACAALEGKPQRCGSQTQIPGNIQESQAEVDGEGRLTHIEWTAETLVLPTIIVPAGWGETTDLDWSSMGPSPASGAIIRTKGLMSAARGMRYKRPDGRQARPDFAVVDDPQTEESATSPVQCEKRLKVIRRSILRLGGHGRAVACVINATIMEDGDLPDTLADRDRHPEWEVERIKMVMQMPSRQVIDDHWLGEYAAIRRSYDRNVPGDRERAIAASTQYYLENREIMDDGAVVAWDDIPLEEGEVSALQHALNIMVDDGEDVFSSECQNEPKRLVSAGVIMLSEKDFQQRTNGFERTIVPDGRGFVVFHIDVHDTLLFWSAAAVGSDFSGSIVDYGVYPEQSTSTFTLRNAKRTLRDLYGLRDDDAKGIEGAILEGLGDLVDILCERRWMTPNGQELPVNCGLIDTGYKPEQVAAAIRSSKHKSILLGSRGVGIGPAERSMTEYDTKPTKVRRAGPDHRAPRWYVPRDNSHSIQVVRFDANYWKDTIHARFATPIGSAGEWSIFGNHRTNHKLFASHLTAQEPVPTSAKGRTVNLWKMKPNRDDHWLDNVVGCAVAASYAGARLGAAPASKPKEKQRKKLSAMRKGR